MSDRIHREDIHFELDGMPAVAAPYETIWQVAARMGKAIPHLCHNNAPGYRPDGNCRSCLVEIEGSGVEISCRWHPTPGMKVRTDTPRVRRNRELVMELLVTDQPPREQAPDPDSSFWQWAEKLGVTRSRFPRRESLATDSSHAGIAVNLDACIHCKLCIRGCSEVQGHDVIGMAGRGALQRIAFDLDDLLGESRCVSCGECVQACPTGALMPASMLDDEQTLAQRPERAVDSVCPYCGVGCQISYQVRDNRILAVEGRNGPANQNRLCVKGRFGFDYASHPERLTTPLIRREDAPKDPEARIDPANPLTHFRQASWDEALERVASSLRSIRAHHGDRALAGFGSAKCSNEEAYLFQKLVRTGFGNNNVDHCTRLCHASSVAALLEGVSSGAVSAPFTAALDADVIIVIGANPVENHPVAASYFRNAADFGATLIVMDPRDNLLSRHATHNLQFRPGSDVALLNAMLHTIIQEELYDHRFIETRTTGFDSLRLHIEDYAPEKMAPICGIDAETIRTVARKYATAHRSIIFWGMGISQSVHGTDNARCLIALALATGQIGRDGTGLHPLRGQNNVQGASDCGLIPFVLPDYQPIGDPDLRGDFEKLWGCQLDPEPGLTVVEIINAAHAGNIKGMYIMGENPALSDPNLRHAREGLSRLEHMVVQDIFLTETAALADVVLPSTAWPEKDGTVTNTNRQIQMGRKAIEAPGDARPDWWITQAIAQRLGLDWDYPDPAAVYEEMQTCMPSIANISWQRLCRDGAATYPCSGDDDPGEAIVFVEDFPSMDGRAVFVPASLSADCEMPDQEYPMVLITARNLEHWHTGSMTRRSTVLDRLEPEPVAMLNHGELLRLELQPGDQVEITTRRGTITLRVRLDDTVPEGAVYLPFGWSEAPGNILTSAKLDPVGKIPSAKYSAARVVPVAEA